MYRLKFTALLTATAFTFSHTALAGGNSSSAIHKAAAERLQSKLGEIRGTIKPAAQNVFLTEFMIEQLKPIKSIEETENDKQASVQPDGTDHNFITHTVEQNRDFATLVSESDLNDLTTTVDQMIETRR